MASSAALLAVRAVHSDLQTPVADILTVVQAGLTGAPRHAPCSLHHCSFLAGTWNFLVLTDPDTCGSPAAGIPFYYYSMTKKDGFVTRDVAKVQVHPECLYIMGGVKVMC